MKTPLGENSYSFLLANKICLQLMGMPSSLDSYYKPWVGFERKGEWGQQKEKGKRPGEGMKRRKRGHGSGGGVSPFYSSLWNAFSAPKTEGDCCLDLLAPLAANRKETLSPFDTILSRSSLRKKEMSSLLGLFTT